MSWQRARQPAQKAERVESILKAAAELMDEHDSLEISMRAIADKAGLGKASLYHYFKTKEEVFASLFVAELEAWTEATLQLLSELKSPSAASVAHILTNVLHDRTRFCILSSVLPSVLERNLTTDHILAMKQAMLPPIGQLSQALSAAFPTLEEAALTDFIYQYQSLVAGLWPLAYPCPAVAEVLENKELNFPRVDFFKLVEKTVTHLLDASI